MTEDSLDPATLLIGLVGGSIVVYHGIILPLEAYIESGKWKMDLLMLVGILLATIACGVTLYYVFSTITSAFRRRKNARINAEQRVKEAERNRIIKENEELKRRKEEIEYKKQKAEEERKQKIRDKKFNKIFAYFEEKESTQAIPAWALHYDESIIDDAQRLYQNIEWEKKERKEKEENRAKQRQYIIKFVLKHKAYPPHFNSYKPYQKEMYHECIKLLKEGKLEDELDTNIRELKDAPKQDKPLLLKKFYYASKLTVEQREKLIKHYGYRNKPFIHRDGSPGNNLVIKNDPRKESDYHFCMKHMFAGFDPGYSEIEYSIDGLRADVVFSHFSKRIAVEIETGKNKEKQIVQKVAWLNKHFTYWLIVCSRKTKPRYRKYVDKKKSFCCTLKEADEKLQELISKICEPPASSPLIIV